MMPILCVLISLAPVTEEIRPHDVIRLKNGSTLTGLMRPGAESGAVAITLVNAEGTVTGEVTIQRADILEIVPRRTQQMIYRDEVKRRDLFDPRQTFELAAWCERPAELAGEAIELAHRSLRLDPDNLEVYPLFARLLAALDPSALSAAQRDREVELALRARERSIFLGSAYLRAARILAGDAWTVLAEEAVALLEAVRAQGSEAEQAEATQALAHLYVANDRLDAVLKLLEAAPEALGEKLRAEVVTRLLVRTRPEDLATAHEIVARMPDDADRKVLDASIAWRRGDAARTETLLLAAIEESSSVETARALGVVLALEGKVKTAAEVVKIVAAAGPDGLLLAHLLGEPAKLEELLTAIASAPGAPLLGAAELFRCDEVEQAE
jgi:tetratricopeptide (TPR) repeat protein